MRRLKLEKGQTTSIHAEDPIGVSPNYIFSIRSIIDGNWIICF